MIKLFQRLFIFVSVVTLFWFVIWLIDSRESQVVSSQPIGRVVNMSAPSGFWDRMVIETEMGFYPLIGVTTISKGTPLVLEQRQSDDRFVCDIPHTLCIKTLGQVFMPQVQTPISPTSTPSDLPSPNVKP